MYFRLHPFAILSIISAFISLVALHPGWRRSTTGPSSLRPLLVSMMIWSGLYSTRWMSLPQDTQVFCFNLMYIGVVTLPTLFLLFILEFTRQQAWLSARRLALLSIHPVAFLLLIWTNSHHHLFIHSINLVPLHGFMTLEVQRGPLFLVNMAYSYTLLSVAMILLARSALRSGPMYRQQYVLLFIGSLIPWASDLYSEYHPQKLGGLDLAPITLGLSGIIFVFAVLRVHLWDLIPVARSYVIENMRDGILVLDVHNRIVDINPAMQSFLENKPASYMGKNVSEVFSNWMEHADSFWRKAESHAEFPVPRDASRYLDLRVTSLYDRNHTLNGRLMVFRDITERKQVERSLRHVNDRLQTQLIEIGLLQSKLREQAIRDPLTDLFNRRYLEETLDRELARAGREGYPVCIIMIDLDHFKKVNDRYGHEAGDHVLRALAKTLSELSRRGDFACRYGGEEFVIVMPNIDMQTAYERAQKLRKHLNSLSIPYECHYLSITISMGISYFPGNGETRETVLRAADKAMYGAKEAGRDHILSYDQLRRREGIQGD